MDDGKSFALVLFFALAGMMIAQGKQITRMQREIDLLVKEDLETLKLKRKLDGYPEDD